MRLTPTMTDDAILREIGQRLARTRLNRNLTQAQAAEMAGLSKRTVERLEDGASTQWLNFVRLARALDLIDGLNMLAPDAPPSPIEQAKLRGKVRQRASGAQQISGAKTWAWGDRR